MYGASLRHKEIKLVGSAVTLVAQKLMDEVDSDLAKFISAPLFLDSHNFNPNLHGSKWTDEDLGVFRNLQERNQMLRDHPESYFNELNEIKTDIKANLSLGIQGLLCKDFKSYELGEGLAVGASTLFVSLACTLEHFGLQ